MPFLGEYSDFPKEYPPDIVGREPASDWNIQISFQNLSEVQTRMSSLHQFLYESVNYNVPISKSQIDIASSEIVSAIKQIAVSGTAILSVYENETSKPFPESADPLDPILKVKKEQADDNDLDCEIMELDSVELLAEYVHFCEICGKGFKRDANLRMHMRAHGNQFKTLEALAKPVKIVGSEVNERKIRFSCPYVGCNRNKAHKKFRSLKSVISLKNHFKRSHCPKMFSCNRCKKKSFSVVTDLKSHLKYCGEIRWKCSCGTSFSRKDKLFGHLACFEGHMPADIVDDNEKGKLVSVIEEDEEDDRELKGGVQSCSGKSEENDHFEGLIDGFGCIDGFNLEDMLSTGMDFF